MQQFKALQFPQRRSTALYFQEWSELWPGIGVKASSLQNFSNTEKVWVTPVRFLGLYVYFGLPPYTYDYRFIATLRSVSTPRVAVPMSNSTAKPRISLHLTVFVDPAKKEDYKAWLKPIFEQIQNEPECTFIELFESGAEPGCFRLVQCFDADAKWFLEVSHFA